MAEKRVTIMVIKVDLGCEKCTKKIKKILCGIPQIQSQIYDEKANTVTVTVVCCSPEKIKKKICCKGGDSVKGIEIKEPEKPKPPAPEKPKPPAPEKPKEAPKPKEPEKPKEKPKEPEKPKEKPKEPEKPKEKPKEPEKPKEQEKPKKVVIVEPPKEEAAKPKPPEPAPKAPEPAPKAPEPTPQPPAPAPKAPEPVPVVPAHPPLVQACCQECYEGYAGGPCYQGFGSVAAPCSYEGYGTPGPRYEAYGRPVYDSWGGGGGAVYYGGCRRGCYVGRCDCISAENPSACSIM